MIFKKVAAKALAATFSFLMQNKPKWMENEYLHIFFE
jgi:hypothetical protein